MDDIGMRNFSALHLRRRARAPVEETTPLLTDGFVQTEESRRPAPACTNQRTALLNERPAARTASVPAALSTDSFVRPPSPRPLINNECMRRLAAAAATLVGEPAPINAAPRTAPTPRRISLDNDEWAHVALKKSSARDFFESRAVAHELYSTPFDLTDPVRAAYHRGLAKVLRSAAKSRMAPSESGGHARLSYRHRRRCFALESVFNELINEPGGVSLLSHMLFDQHAFERFEKLGGVRRTDAKIEAGRERGRMVPPTIEEMRPSHKDIAEARPYPTEA